MCISGRTALRCGFAALVVVGGIVGAGFIGLQGRAELPGALSSFSEWGSRWLRSSVTCKGAAELEVGPLLAGPDANNCLFENVCVGADGIYEFYALDEQDEGAVPPASNLSLRSVLLNPSDAAPLHFRVVRRWLDAGSMAWGDAEVYTEIQRYTPDNFGHTLGDDVFPIFRAVRAWNLSDGVEIQVIADTLRNAKPFGFITSRPLVQRPRSMCFRKFIAGHRGLGYVAMGGEPGSAVAEAKVVGATTRLTALAAYLRHFRDFVFRRSGIAVEPPSCFLFLEKDMKTAWHKSGIGNMDELVLATGALKQRCTKRASWNGMPLRDQLVLMASTRVLVSLPGSDIMNGVFLQDGTAMVIPWRNVAGIWEGSNEVDVWFQHADHLRVDLYKPKDVVFAGDLMMLNASDVARRANRLFDGVA